MNPKHTGEISQIALLTAKEAAAYLRISLSTLHRMEQRSQIHSLRTPGGHRRYTIAMLNACLAIKSDIEILENC